MLDEGGWVGDRTHGRVLLSTIPVRTCTCLSSKSFHLSYLSPTVELKDRASSSSAHAIVSFRLGLSTLPLLDFLLHFFPSGRRVTTLSGAPEVGGLSRDRHAYACDATHGDIILLRISIKIVSLKDRNGTLPPTRGIGYRLYFTTESTKKGYVFAETFLRTTVRIDFSR